MPILEEIMNLLRPARRAAPTTLPSRLQAPDPQFIADLNAATGRPGPPPSAPPRPLTAPAPGPSRLPSNLAPPAPPLPVQPASLQGVNPTAPIPQMQRQTGARVEHTALDQWSVYDANNQVVLQLTPQGLQQRLAGQGPPGAIAPQPQRTQAERDEALRQFVANRPPLLGSEGIQQQVPASIARLTPGAQASIRRAYNMVIRDGRLPSTTTFEQFADRYTQKLRSADQGGGRTALQRTIEPTPSRQAAQNMATPQPGSMPPPVQARAGAAPPRRPLANLFDDPNNRAFSAAHLTPRGISEDEFLEKYVGGWYHPMYTSLGTGRGTSSRLATELRIKPGMYILDRNGQRMRDNAFVGTMTRDLNPSSGTFYNAYFALSDNVRGGGIAKWMLKNQYELYDRMGITKGSVSAGLDMGGYVWAKYGFIPARADWRAVARLAEARLRNLVSRGQVSTQTKSMVERLLQSDDPKTIWQLSDLNTPLVGANEPNMTVGKKLLMGQHWHGDIDLTNNVQRDRFNLYVRDARSPYTPPSP